MATNSSRFPPQIFGAGQRVMSLRDGTKKMSKSDVSDYSRINLTDAADAIALKIKKAKTDPAPLPASKDESQKRPEADNLLEIYAALSGLTPGGSDREFAGKQFSAFKNELADLAAEVLGKIGAEIRRVAGRSRLYRRRLETRRGARQRHGRADLRQVFDIMGLLRP